MTYLAVRFDADACSADAWSDALLETGALSVDIADPHEGTPDETARFDEPGVEWSRFWPISRLTALFAPTSTMPAITDALAGFGMTLPPHETFVVADEDWVRSTRDQFKPIRIDERLWIVPSWCDPVDRAAINLRLDPGLAFGTGSHPTTSLCLRWLAHELRVGESVLDYGCGSGILAIAARLLGAGKVVGTDIDPFALSASRANAERNRVDAVFVDIDTLDEPMHERYDVVVANILANPLISLAAALGSRVRDQGRIVLSGVLQDQAESVMAAYRRWFNMRPHACDEGWVVLVGTRCTGDRAE